MLKISQNDFKSLELSIFTAKENLINFINNLKKTDQDLKKYWGERSDNWYDSDAAIDHDCWEQEIEFKLEEMEEIVDLLENFEIKNIKSRKSSVLAYKKEFEPRELMSSLIKTNKDINDLNVKQKLIIERIKEQNEQHIIK